MFGKKSALDRLAEEQLYEAVALEIKNNELREGLWAKALAKAKGDHDQAKGLYIELRVQSLRDELVVANQVKQEALNEERRQKEIARVAEEERAAKKAQDQTIQVQKLARKLHSFQNILLSSREGGGWLITFKGEVVMSCDSLSDIEQFIVLWSEKLEREKFDKNSDQNSYSNHLGKGVFIFTIVTAAILWLVLG